MVTKKTTAHKKSAPEGADGSKTALRRGKASAPPGWVGRMFALFRDLLCTDQAAFRRLERLLPYQMMTAT